MPKILVNLFFRVASIQQKVVRLAYDLIKNQALVDGKKRIVTHLMFVFLTFNNIEYEYIQQDLSDVILKIAEESSEFEDLLYLIIIHQT